MTINADCNNNKLEVSVTSNGLEVTSAAASQIAAETEAEDRTTAALAEVGSSSSGANSRSASTSPPPNTVAVVSHSRRASPPKKRTAVFINSNSGNSSAKSPAKQTTTVQRHQSMPVTATTTTSDVQQVVKVGKQQQPLETMAPSRPTSMTANHHHQHNFNSNLPPLDNCDSIFAIVSLPATVNSRTSDAKQDAPLNTGSEGVQNFSSKSPPLPPLVKSDRQQRKKFNYSFTSSSPTSISSHC
ncbi:hypothetical protein TYRP_011773 [Tyrophagus putrescentiae]|nr:hypothetical protein TYRP_011773 [Tyrophagus putrescentiae]